MNKMNSLHHVKEHPKTRTSRNEMRSKASPASLSCLTRFTLFKMSKYNIETVQKYQFLRRLLNDIRFSPQESIMQITEIRIEADEALDLFPYKSLKSEIALTLNLLLL